MYRRFFLIITIIFLVGIVNQSSSQNVWTEVRGGYWYRYNDFYIKNFYDYHLTNINWKTGLKIFLKKSEFTFQPYFLYTKIRDCGNADWNKVDWHNHRVIGGGLRLRYNPGKIISIIPQELNIDLFIEFHQIKFKQFDLFYTGHRPGNDVKTGFQFWCAYNGYINKSRLSVYYWTDNAGAVYYSRNTFFVRDRNNFYLVNLHNSTGTGLNIPGFLKSELYWTIIFCYDLGSAGHNKLHWHNNLQSGPGARFKFTKSLKWSSITVDVIIIPFAEILWIAYPEKVDYIPRYRPSSDVRTGVDLWLSVY